MGKWSEFPDLLSGLKWADIEILLYFVTHSNAKPTTIQAYLMRDRGLVVYNADMHNYIYGLQNHGFIKEVSNYDGRYCLRPKGYEFLDFLFTNFPNKLHIKRPEHFNQTKPSHLGE